MTSALKNLFEKYTDKHSGKTGKLCEGEHA